MIYLGCKNFSLEEDEHYTIHKTIWKNIDLSIKGLNSFYFWFSIVFLYAFFYFRVFLIENKLFAFWLCWIDPSTSSGSFSLAIIVPIAHLQNFRSVYVFWLKHLLWVATSNIPAISYHVNSHILSLWYEYKSVPSQISEWR